MWTKRNFELTFPQLLDKFRRKIEEIVAQVREKLKKDAEDQGLLKVVKKEPTPLSANPPANANKE